ncbi:MAG: DUF3368 domain-containing protein [Cyanobacteria bacterium P01_F01_bin.150]
MNESIPTVCIDETVGRRIAKLSGLSITGSVGILLKAKQLDPSLSVTHHIQRMQNQGIRLSQRLVQAALKQAGENLPILDFGGIKGRSHHFGFWKRGSKDTLRLTLYSCDKLVLDIILIEASLWI